MEKSSEGRPMAQPSGHPFFSSRFTSLNRLPGTLCAKYFLAFRRRHGRSVAAPATLTTGSACAIPGAQWLQAVGLHDADLQDLFVRARRPRRLGGFGRRYSSTAPMAPKLIPQPSRKSPHGPKVPSPPEVSSSNPRPGGVPGSAHARRLEQPNYPNQQLPEAQPNNMPAPDAVDSKGSRAPAGRASGSILRRPARLGAVWTRKFGRDQRRRTALATDHSKQWPRATSAATGNRYVELPPYGIKRCLYGQGGGWSVGNGAKSCIRRTMRHLVPQTVAPGIHGPGLRFSPMDGSAGPWTPGGLWRSDDGGRAWTVRPSENQALPCR